MESCTDHSALQSKIPFLSLQSRTNAVSPSLQLVKSEKLNFVSSKSLSARVRSYFSSHKDAKLAEKYISLWKIYVIHKKKSRLIQNKNDIIESKISNFCINYRIHLLTKSNNDSVSVTDKNMRKNSNASSKHCRNEMYDNRFTAQKEIIESQKALISEQTKVINELKYKQNLQLISDTVVSELESVDDSSRPERVITPLPEHPLVKKMKEREEERRQHREFFEMKKKEKEKYLTEKLKKEEEERKKVEKERRKNEIRERKEEERKQKLKELERQKELEFCATLESVCNTWNDAFVCKRMLSLWNFRILCMNNRKNTLIEFVEKSVVTSYMNSWRSETIYRKQSLTNLINNIETLSLVYQCVGMWKKKVNEARRVKAVATHCIQTELRQNYFDMWLKTSRKSVMVKQEVIKKVHQLYERALVFKCFILWRNLPLVLFHEREKEKRLLEWENKVKSILPDYNLDVENKIYDP